MSSFKPPTPDANVLWQGSNASQLRSLPEQIAERIYASIVSGEYEPGDRIREEALSEAYQVSRGPIREALRLLERDSVVTVLPNRGAHVTPLSPDELNEIFEIRKVLLGALARRLSKLSPAFLSRFREGVEVLDALAQDPKGATAYSAASVALGLQLAQATQNKRLAQILKSLARQSWRYTQLALSEQHRRVESAGNWHRLYESLRDERFSDAGDAIEKLVEDARVEALGQLQRVKPTPS